MSDPRAVRVSLGPASARPDIDAVVMGPDDPASGYRVERVDGDRLIVVDDADPATRTAVVVLGSGGGSGHHASRDGIERREVLVDGWRFEVEVESAARATLREKARRGRSEAGGDGPVEVRAIIPGVVVTVSVAPGDAVSAGQQLLVVEAMKMQNELRAPRDGVVGRVAIGERQTIEVGDLLAVIE
jgi:biotin carboxyl carrier protein